MGRSRHRNTTRARVAVPTAVQSADVPSLLNALAVARSNTELAEQRLIDATGDGYAVGESVADLERVLHDPGWQRFATLTAQEFTPDGRQQMRAVCRLMALASPLIKRGLALRSAYVHGQGVQVVARADGARVEDGEQDVRKVVSDWWADDANQRALTGPSALDRLERCLGTDGEFFIAAFTRPLSGWVQTRVILTDEIADIICNPEDRTEPWYYRREWYEITTAADGTQTSVFRKRLYPALGYRPRTRLRRIGGVDIAWDSPMLHVDVNRPEGWQHGVPDSYAAINWARAYKEFLEQWATLMKSLARFAWRLTAKGSQRGQAKQRLGQAPPRDPNTGAAQDVGATAITPMDTVLEAIPKSGATIDSESGRPLAMMVAAALGIPVTMLLSDPGQTGARATAETLDQPTELEMQGRRGMWTGVILRLVRHVIYSAVKAPHGPLQGTVRWDRDTDREIVTLVGDTDQTVDVTWPDLDDPDQLKQVQSAVQAASTGLIPPEVLLRLLLQALGVRDPDSILREMVGDDGEFLWPTGPPGGAVPAGGDPADAGPGRMAPDGDGDAGADDEDVDEAEQAAIEAEMAESGITVPNVLFDLREARSDAKLRAYWGPSGKGGARIRWGTKGDFTRCVRHLRKHVRDPEGLCAVYHRRAVGFWPGDRRNRS